MDAQRMHILGGSGTGTTTLGRALADAWSVPHADADDYFWEPTDPPYTTQRDPSARLNLMQQLFLPRPAWVLSGSVMGWGEPLISSFDAVIFLTIDKAQRLHRLRERETRRYGTRIEPGGDRAEAFAAFLEWAAGYDDPNFAGRSLALHEYWLSQLSCPVLRLDSARPPAELVEEVRDWQPPAVS
jgi:adenylate kinase family enzyme